MLTDILHVRPKSARPAYRQPPAHARGAVSAPADTRFEGGLVEIGARGAGFAFDCERPRHRVFIEPFSLADRPVTNGEWLEFIADGGYRRAAAVAVRRLGEVLRGRLAGAALLGERATARTGP